MDYKMLSNKMKYTSELLHSVMIRDNAILVGKYDKLTRDILIKFICHCGNEYNKRFRCINEVGANCDICTVKEKNEKRKKSNLILYGVEHPLQSNEIKQKAIQTYLTKYGLEHSSQSPEIKEKVKQTNIKRFGVECSLLHHDAKEKSIQTCLARHGVEHYSQTEAWKKQLKNTIRIKYGVDHALQSQDFKEKAAQTCLTRYGVDHYSKTKAYKEQIIKTNMEHYGVSNATKTKATRDKIKETCLARYGVENPAQCQEIMEKTQKNAKKYKEYNMPSGMIRKVQGYEPFALNELVKIYQEDDIITDRKEIPRITYMVNDKKKYYFPDIFIKSINTIIEVKSTWTYNSKIDNIHEKENATKMAGYNYEIWIFDRKGNKIETNKIEKEFDNHG